MCATEGSHITCTSGVRSQQMAAWTHEIDVRIDTASTSFGALWRRLWFSHNIKTETKIHIYNAIMLAVLLYGTETWTLYHWQIGCLRYKQLKYHLRAILRSRYQDNLMID